MPDRAALPWQLVRVHGPSMVPALRHGDAVLVRHGAVPRAGDIVLGRFRTMPRQWVIKRADHPSDGGWWLRSDNSLAGGDSAVHGVADVSARGVLIFAGGRWWRPRRLRRVV